MSEDRTPLFMLWESIEDGLNVKIQGVYPIHEIRIVHPPLNPLVLIELYKGDQRVCTMFSDYEIKIVDNVALTVFSMVTNLATKVVNVIKKYEASGGARRCAFDDPTNEYTATNLRVRRLAIAIDGGGE